MDKTKLNKFIRTLYGNIPYNGPGKVGAQILDDANFTRNMAMAYDLLEPAMNENERQHIREDLLKPAAEFLMPGRHKQQHNHELIISAAVAMVGLILGREDWVQYAVYEDYGLLYQLEHGVTDSGMWFEGTFGYHFYALEGFFQYERFAVHTAHSHIHHPLYGKMLKAAARYAQPDFNFPMLNDTYVGHGTLAGKAELYEFAYRELREPQLLEILNRMYQDRKRDGVECFLWGVEELPENTEKGQQLSSPWQSDCHPEIGQAGITILRGPEDRYLLFKQDEFGGEHDHYDRLALSFLAYGKRIAADLGTTGYGAVLHYDYYKNSGSHNTVTIGERNHPPGKAALTRFQKADGVTYVEACMDWTKEYRMPPIFIIQDWDEKVYQDVIMTRKLAWTDRYFVECFVVEGAGEHTVDWGMHIGGAFLKENFPMQTTSIERFSENKPLRHMKNIYYIEESDSKSENVICSRFRVEDVGVKLYSYLPQGSLYIGTVPDNPSINRISQVVERRSRGTAKENGCRKEVFLHVMEAYREESCITAVHMGLEKQEAVVTIEERERVREIRFAAD